MSKKSIGLIILCFCEAIIAVRVLLFAIPVIISKLESGSFAVSQMDNRFIVVLTAAALIYFIVGAASVMGYRYWKAIQYLGMIFTLIITFGSIGLLGVPQGGVHAAYFTPAYASLFFAVCVVFLGGARKAA